MTLSQIQCFLMVAEKMSITEAANALYVTQPAVSHRISKLEQELGTELFHRDNSKLVLTSAGKKYVDFLKNFVEGLDKISKEIKNESKVSENIMIGCTDGWDISEIFISLKEKLEKEHPEITVSLDVEGNDELFTKIKNGNVDIAVALEGIFMASNEMSAETVGKTRGALIFAKNHPMAGREDLSFEDFKDYPFYIISSPKNKYMSAELMQYALKKGVNPTVEYVSSLSTVLVKMRTEFGVLAADENIIQKQNTLFDSIELDYTRDICVGIKKDHTESQDIVRRMLTELCRERFQCFMESP